MTYQVKASGPTRVSGNVSSRDRSQYVYNFKKVSQNPILSTLKGKLLSIRMLSLA